MTSSQKKDSVNKDVQNSQVTKSSNETELRKVKSHFELLT